jgi:hypothetical protein
VTYAVARRTNEIGIRVAFGTLPGGVAWMVLRETLVLGRGRSRDRVPAVFALDPVLNHFLEAFPRLIDLFLPAGS